QVDSEPARLLGHGTGVTGHGWYSFVTRCSGSDAAPLRRAATVVGHRGDVLDRADLEAGSREGPDRGLPARAGTAHEDIDLLHPVLHGTTGGRLGAHLGGERRRLPRPLEADGAGAGPRDHVAVGVGDRDDRVVERAPDVRVSEGDVLLLLAAHLLGAGRSSALGRHLLRELLGSRERGCEEAAGGAASGTTADRGLLATRLLLAGDGLPGTLA